MEGRLAGSQGERKTAEYLYSALSRSDITMISKRSGDEFRIANGKDTITSRNVIGIIEGYDPELRDEYIVVGAHMDNIGTYSVVIDGKSYTRAFAGADGNASGVAALIEVADILAQNAIFLRRSVIFVGFGAGEREMAGSRYFLSSNPSLNSSSVKMMIDLDMLGRGDLSNPFQIYTTISRNDITSIMNHVRDNESYTVQPTFFNGTFFSSDYLPFQSAGIPNLLFSTGRSKEYHTAKDTPSLVNYENLAAEAIYIAAFIKSAAIKDNLYPSKSVAAAEAEKVYAASDCDVRPQFFHSDESHYLNTWVYKYLNYPQDAIREGIQGRIMVSFIIEKDGSVTNVKLENHLYDSLDDEVLRVVSVSPKWIPGEIDGKKVRTRIVLPVEFRLKQR
ncbi:MAG: TonB family protein [Bacteroidales bacterium]|nr:TonB family protein [Bacteroidales bacterium]